MRFPRSAPRVLRPAALVGAAAALVVPLVSTPAGPGALSAVSAASTAATRTSLPPNVTFPVAASGRPVDQRTYVAGRHNGTEITAPCGTPVVAAHPGTARVLTGETWAGPSLVKVYTTRGRLTTWYAYLGDVDVTDGQLLQAGQQVGTVGDAGSADRCELGFQVRNDEGATVRNPSRWLDTYVGAASPIRYLFGNRGFVIASFNVLGASHTKPGGDAARRYAGWATRLPKEIRTLSDKAVDVAGLQEFQKVQRDEFVKKAGGTYAVYPSDRRMDTENSIVWRKSAFDLVEANRFDVRYFNGSIRKMPYVLLKQRTTGLTAYFINVHNPANTSQYRHQEKWRAMAIQAERDLVVKLRATGRPVFLTGDMNDRANAYCPLAAGKLMLAPHTVPSMTCALPPKPWIDWVLAAGPTRFSAFSTDWSVKDDLHATDHPIITARAHLAE